ncbi:hypothetical protein [Exiguobacterium acetylicum]|uniref:hypothetical protein n=1 Tax=Exiguobacterium acetylicum TaxID=41170 RepID=UPI000682D0C5|nr:hypothetical protein [Exiguobacterium acetylicum]KNH35613.1 hypothetical protein ACS74_06940 [Exiguobacterium acetylicum]
MNTLFNNKSVQIKILKKERKNQKLSNFILHYVKSIQNGHIDDYIKLHRNTRESFHTEQTRWFKTVTKQKAEFTYTLSKVMVDSFSENLIMKVFLLVDSEHADEKEIFGTYLIKEDAAGYFIESLFSDSLITLNQHQISFPSSLKEQAENTSSFIKKIFRFYKELIDPHFKFKKLNIIFFDSLETISFSVPIHSTYGWYESNESIKIFIPKFIENKKEFLSKILLHELTHVFLTECTHNNLALCFQEGFAMYLEGNYEQLTSTYNPNFLKNDYSEQVSFSKSMLTNELSSILSLEKVILLSEEDGIEVYHQGFLWINYLIKKYGLTHFLLFLKSFNMYNINNDSISQSRSLTTKNTIIQTKLFYPDEIMTNSNIIKFYNVKKSS